MAKWSNEKMADLTRKLADTAIEQNELYQAALRDAKEAEAYAEELEAKLFSCATDLDIYMSAHASLEAKLAKIVAIVRSHDTGDMQREDMEVRRILQRIEVELTGGKNA